MIHFLIGRDSLEVGMGRYLRTRGQSLQGVVCPQLYEEVMGASSVPTGTWVFAALDTLTPAERQLASSLKRQLEIQGNRTLNDPDRSLLRYQLLEALYDGGINSFRAVRVRDFRGGLRFPVFLRTDAGHYGNLSPLLYSEAEVRRELLSAKLRRLDLDNLLVVEFLDLASGGHRHKYSAFRVGDAILGRHYQTSNSNWMIKSESGDRTADAAYMERAYIDANPHADQLAPLFELANIDYGRMDYAVHRGRIEVFEINTAPTLGRGGATIERTLVDDPYRTAMEPTIVAFHGRMCHAFKALTKDDGPVELSVAWNADLLRAREKERATAERHTRQRDRLSRLANVAGIRWLRKGMEAALRSFRSER